jgi:predicted RNase H-like HicB family nuclease
MNFRYPTAIKLGNKTRAFSVVVPDLPGCFSAAENSIDQAIELAKEAIELWIETALDRNETVPYPSNIIDLQKKREFKGWVWAIVEIDPALLSNAIERVNITLPKRILAKLDKTAKAQGTTRSGLIAELALRA